MISLVLALFVGRETYFTVGKQSKCDNIVFGGVKCLVRDLILEKPTLPALGKTPDALCRRRSCSPVLVSRRLLCASELKIKMPGM